MKRTRLKKGHWRWYPLKLSPADEVANHLKHVKSWTDKERIRPLSDQALYKMHLDVLKFAAYCVRHPKQGATRLHSVASLLADAVSYLGMTKDPLTLLLHVMDIEDQARLLNKDRETAPQKYEWMMRQRPAWPVVYSPFPDYKTDTSTLKRKLTHPHFNLWGKGTKRHKPISFLTPSNDLARCVHKCLNNNKGSWENPYMLPGLKREKNLADWFTECRGLGRFTADTVDRWIETGWKCIMWHYAGHPETDPHLAVVGQARASKALAVEKMRVKQVRYGIKEEFSAAMKRLAGNKTPSTP